MELRDCEVVFVIESAVAIRVRGLSFSYGGSKCVLSDFDYDFLEGGKYLITGGNGEGKTTLLKCIIGSLKPQRGNIETCGISKSGLAYCGQEKAKESFPVSVREVLSICMRDAGKRRARNEGENHGDFGRLKCFESLLVWVEPFLGRNFYDLSGGEKQKVSLLRCLMQRPEAMLLDEPTSFLDSESQRVIFSALEELTMMPVTILATSHDGELLDRLTGIGWISVRLGGGKIVF